MVVVHDHFRSVACRNVDIDVSVIGRQVIWWGSVPSVLPPGTRSVGRLDLGLISSRLQPERKRTSKDISNPGRATGCLVDTSSSSLSLFVDTARS